jgi:hypothetical protein
MQIKPVLEYAVFLGTSTPPYVIGYAIAKWDLHHRRTKEGEVEFTRTSPTSETMWPWMLGKVNAHL